MIVLLQSTPSTATGLDTAEQRGSLINLDLLWGRLLPEADGIIDAAGRLSLVGLCTTSEAVGTQTLAPSSIASGEGVGTARLTHRLLLTGVPTSETVGTPTLLVTTDQTLSAAGAIGSAEAFGTASVANTTQKLLTGIGGIPSAQILGTPIVIVGPAPPDLLRRLFLVEMHTGLAVRSWSSATQTWGDAGLTCDSQSIFLDGQASVFVRTMPQIDLVAGVTQDGIPLTEAADETAVNQTAGTWHWDPITHVIRINTTDGADVARKVIVVEALEPLAFGSRSVIKSRHGRPIFWDARVRALPSIELALSSDEPGGGVTTLGELVLDNADARYDAMIAERLFVGRPVRILTGLEVDAYDAFVPWATGTMDTVDLTDERATISMLSLARRLDAPMLRTVWAPVTRPDLPPADEEGEKQHYKDGRIDRKTQPHKRPRPVRQPPPTTEPEPDPNEGRLIPKVFGRVAGAEALRVAPGLWQIADHPLAEVSRVRLRDDAQTEISFTADLALARVAIDPVHDETGIAVDCMGLVAETPGEMFAEVALVGGLLVSELDRDGLDLVDKQRPVALGFQVVDGTIRDALDRVARSSFCDWLITRENTLSAVVRRWDLGNRVANPGFEATLDRWAGINNATISRVTTPVYDGVGAMVISKPAGEETSEQRGTLISLTLVWGRILPDADGAIDQQNRLSLIGLAIPVSIAGTTSLAHAITRGLAYTAGRHYAITMVAATVNGSTTAFRAAITEGPGTEALFDAIALSDAEWTRYTVPAREVQVSDAFLDSDAQFWDDATLTCDQRGGELLLYPEYGGTGAVDVVVDAVEVCEATIRADDTNCRILNVQTQPLILRTVRVRYGVDGLEEGEGTWVVQATSQTQYAVGTGESLDLDGDLRTQADAEAVAASVLDYLGRLRVRVVMEIYDLSQPVRVGSVMELATTRRPALPGSPFYRVLRVSEVQAGGSVPTITLEAEAAIIPRWDVATILAT
jgi:hypothetical protein